MREALVRAPADTIGGVSMETNSFWDVLLWSFWFFIWIAALMVWFRCLMDLFGDHALSGWAKAGWVILLIFVPWLGALIYLIARGRSMAERQMKALAEQQAAQQKYIQEAAGKTATPAAQIADAKALLDSGAINQTEFDSLKAKALA
jgi:Phospholipase_D-nuclease N-terminal